ncbi:reverse transcriptase [Gossypium australe]|uniref:Reverse transcriptase n=1 Tax=Gossypium australe TaxID=47621 RepID=A0A5B6UHK2_9ROSI|nr:reverse transcriptase [Gossypium australe]
MEESRGVERESGEEISLLAEELIQLSIKKSLVESTVKPTLICSVWTKKSFNTENFRAQLKSIWKTKKKFEIQVVGQNLFLIVFDLEEDLELIMEGRPWLFRKYLILFDRIRDLVERDQIRLTSSPYWIKIGPCPPEYDKKDLMHAIGSTYSGILRSEIKDDSCRFMVNLDVQKPLRRGKPKEQNGQEEEVESMVLPGILLGGKKLTSWEEGLKKQEGDSVETKIDMLLIIRRMEVLELKGNVQKRGMKKEKRMKQEKMELKVRRLRNLIKQYNPYMIFLMETKLNQKRMERVRNMSGFINGIDIEVEGTRGGLCLAWNDNIAVTLKIYSKWHIDVIVKEDSRQEDWRFTGFYGSPYLKDQNSVWNLLRRLSCDCNCPWLVAGDFNEIMYSFEKSGRLPRDTKRIEVFRDTLEECHLMDIGYSGAWFTWERGNLPETNIRERLDRGSLPFAYSFEGALKDIWESSSDPLVDKLKKVQIGLKKWAKELKCNKGEQKRRLTKELEVLLMEDRDEETLAKIIDKKIHLNMEIDKDQVYWEQRARANWLQFEDRNTAYFHKCATTRRRVNFINKLSLDDGREITDDLSLKEEAKTYFENLFSSKGVANPSKVPEGIKRSISHEINEGLQSPFREEEVRTTLNGMGSTKVPRPDGFPALFFQKYWHIVGKEVLEFCLGILNG